MTPDEDGWRRLNPLSLLMAPVKLGRQLAVPAFGVLVGVTGSGHAFAGIGLTLLIGVGAIVFSTIPWVTTRYRVTTTQFERTTGLVGRGTSSAALDRVRSVDLEANLLHRLLGLTRVKIGTGVDDKRIELDALSRPEADDLRRFLLDRSGTARAAESAASASAAAPDESDAPPVTPVDLVARLDWGWIRFAPFSLARLAVVAAAFGVASQAISNLTERIVDESGVVVHQLRALPWALAVVFVLAAALSTWVVIACAGFVWTWTGLRVVREHGTVKISSGLVNTRTVSVDEDKIRGMCLREPWLLRLVHGADLSALSTGVGKGGRTQVLPSAPLDVVVAVGGDLLGALSPLRVPLLEHGPAARRRCHVRAQRPSLAVLVVGIALALWTALPWWMVPIAVVLAAGAGAVAGAAAYAHLGHHLDADHLVAGSGVTMRKREVLETDGIIGWVVKQSFFQRRRGLATLVATTAAGGESVHIRDVPLPRAVDLVARVSPRLVG